MVDRPPHGISALGHRSTIYFTTSDHDATLEQHSILVLLDHPRELSQSNLSIPGILVLEFGWRKGIGAEGSVGIGGSFGSAHVGMQDTAEFHMHPTQPALHCLQVYLHSGRIKSS